MFVDRRSGKVITTFEIERTIQRIEAGEVTDSALNSCAITMTAQAWESQANDRREASSSTPLYWYWTKVLELIDVIYRKTGNR